MRLLFSYCLSTEHSLAMDSEENLGMFAAWGARRMSELHKKRKAVIAGNTKPHQVFLRQKRNRSQKYSVGLP